ncbi:hypothetical protein SO078_30700 (plasmid) [Sinorhizobium meliloti]|uniref:hypothetical protein n=1 Tax=Rhizobium meliloti TaxID=382 RepID=UPI002D77A1B6|nr:hypothetical protein [Sinorhizobium meliloti]WRQ71896.1 hypothetical protein SO078_30700 [Sinorhizobium meliloti]
MQQATNDRSHPISPEELNDLQVLLRRVLNERNLAMESAEAEDIAATLIELYQGGVRDLSALRALVG